MDMAYLATQRFRLARAVQELVATASVEALSGPNGWQVASEITRT